MPDQSTVRIVTATSLFDGHDAAINIMRRILQSAGAEVIHLGHDRSAAAIAEAAIEEDAHAVAVTSYQGGHMEFYTYLRALLDESAIPAAGATSLACSGWGARRRACTSRRSRPRACSTGSLANCQTQVDCTKSSRASR